MSIQTRAGADGRSWSRREQNNLIVNQPMNGTRSGRRSRVFKSRHLDSTT
ncbi:hypothetical protein SAMN05216469_11174 [Ruminococcus albus]|uniref:Uncharacterized protein n=1 Tax=Ruminococcus albus TaxID=1264 RepID=A0A1H7MD38_RUMAL|nr:hypothetical protein SAMN05216469_11174 [Ruminococcus albus]